ncbi:MAG: glucose 1-dehydrogenase [Gammaproteobacteria bacterium]|nr:glucose 1-dehydrogenase [Gammaproteobacteria bacterium]
MKLIDKTAVVTGGASGFGAGIVTRFLAEGARVAIVDLNEAGANALIDSLETDRVHFEYTNLTDSDSVSETFAKLRDRWDSLDILVNNAGTTHLPMQMEDVTEKDFDKVFAVNAKSVFYTSKFGVPWMKNAGAGTIVNIASTAALSPRANLTWYNASKGWMVTATKSMAIELAPAGIRVNAICPVAGETPLLASFMGGDTPATREKFIASIPLGRLSTPEDIAATALYLSSDDAAMITGVALEVDGGRCI